MADGGLGRPLHDHLGHRRQRGQRLDDPGRLRWTSRAGRSSFTVSRMRRSEPAISSRSTPPRARSASAICAATVRAVDRSVRAWPALRRLDALEDVLGGLVPDAGHADDLPRAAHRLELLRRLHALIGQRPGGARGPARGSRGRSGTRPAPSRAAPPAAAIRPDGRGTRRCGRRGHARCRAGGESRPGGDGRHVLAEHVSSVWAARW